MGMLLFLSRARVEVSGTIETTEKTADFSYCSLWQV
jgi:hypothetical protein